MPPTLDLQSIIEKLNPAQVEAVTTTEGPLMVIAGAGTGKTRVITHRIAWLVGHCGVEPWQIFASTFTNKAAEEMRNRVAHILPGTETARISVATFHSICVTIMRREAEILGLAPNFTIADESDQRALVKDCLRTLELDANQVQPAQALQWISAAKTMMYGPAEARDKLSNEWGDDYARIYELYEERLATSNAVDFDDLLLKVVRMYQSRPDVLTRYQDRWRYFLVDEYQDINQVQFELVRLLAGRDRNLCVVGDEDQSIYSWRGANIETFLNFPKHFEGAKRIRLEQNYRSTDLILEAANAVISHNRQRLGKNLWSERPGGDPLTLIVGYSEREEAALVVDSIHWLRRVCGVRHREMAIFYRVNALSRLYEDYLRQEDIPYRVIGGVRFYDRAEIKDLLAYLRLIVNPANGIGFSRIINRPRRGIGEKTLNQLISDAAAASITLWEQMGIAIEAKQFSKRARAGMIDLRDMMDKWRTMSENHTPGELLDEILHDTRYEDGLGNPNALETLSRKENIEELRRALEDFQTETPGGTLCDYLERVTLASAIDAMSESDDCVSLMTLHSAKGLEFPAVFMTGLEEGIFPSGRTLAEVGGLEEERRLFYVGITRAKDRLFLSRADSRTLYGRTQYNPPSTFLMEVPAELTQSLEDSRENSAPPGAAGSSPSVMLGAGPASAMEDPSAQSRSTPQQRGRFETNHSGRAGSGPPRPGAVSSKYPTGTRVRHATLGEGEVTGAHGDGEERQISIRFDAGLELELFERYAELEIVQDLPF